MGLILCIAGCISVGVLVRRSFGDGLGLLLAIGSVYGIARCVIFDGFTHFLFDASVLGAYVGGLRRIRDTHSLERTGLRAWLLALATLPIILILLSPFIDAQPILVQLLGLRPALFFLPILLLGASATVRDWDRLATWAAFLAIGAAVVAGAEYSLGIEQFFPINDASRIIYLSGDVGAAGDFRIPATFSSAHAYGGAMVGLLPLLILLVEAGGWKRKLGIVALVAAVLGVFACAARTPVIALGALGVAVALRGLKRPGVRAAVVLAGLLAGIIVSRESRFQRFETLSDADYVQTRVAGSVNVGLLDTVAEYPLGRGLGSAVGTSIPYFLAAEAKPQVGMENEYARIGVEQGLLGVLLWMAFASWVLMRNPLRLRRFGGVVDLGMWSVCVYTWATGLIGTGFLASIPGTLLLFLFMGGLLAPEDFGTVPSAELVGARLRPVTL